jgi:plastocyanin
MAMNDPNRRRSKGGAKHKLAAVAVIAAVALIIAGPLRAAITTIDQKGQKFSITSVVIAVGDVIQYQNHDDVTHDIMVIDEQGEATDEGLQRSGEIIAPEFDHPGTYQVRCSIHPRMKMTVVVR